MKKLFTLFLTITVISSVIVYKGDNSYAVASKTYATGDYDDSKYRHGGYDAGYDPNYDCNEIDDQETKYFFKEKFAFPEDNGSYSGWDTRTIGGDIKGVYFRCNYEMNDTSNVFPVETSRTFEKAKHGELTFEAVFSITKSMDDFTINLREENKNAISLITKGGSFYLKNSYGSDTFLFDYNEGAVYGLKIIFDIDTDVIKEIYLNGKLLGMNYNFTNPVSYINYFTSSTGYEEVGSASYQVIKLYRGFNVNETFTTSMNTVPDDFNAAGNVSTLKSNANVPPDLYSLLLNGNEGESSVSKNFKYISGKTDAQYYFYTAEKTDGIYASWGGSKPALTLKTQNGKFGYINVSGEFVPLYDYWKNVWYRVDVYFNFNSHTADIYLNYKPIAERISTSPEVDGISGFKAGITGAGEFALDDVIIRQHDDYPDDYVPEPNPVTPRDGYTLGMNFCPMWETGYHQGYDKENRDKDRLPYIGYYDEDSPEALDWIIKQNVEHGINLFKVTWANSYDGSVVKHAYCSGSFFNAYFKSKYKNLTKFMITWETGVGSQVTPEAFVRDVAPNWIEYYLKDPGYYKINGRPVVCFYDPENMIKKADQNLDRIKTAFEQFRKMCVDAGVGEPLITMGNYPANKEDLEKYMYIGYDGTTAYGGVNFNGDERLEAIVKRLNEQSDSTWNYAASVGMGQDGSIGGGITIGTMDKTHFKKVLQNIKNNILDKDRSDNLFSKLIFLDTYDEYSEGHWVAPSGIHGYDYFDAAREVFVDENKHVDSAPNMKQKDRFNNGYPYGRSLPAFDAKRRGDYYSETLSVKKGWYFKDGLQGWKSANMNNFRVSNGNAVGNPVNADPQMYIGGLNIDLSDVTHVRVRFGSTQPSNTNQIFFGTKDYPGFSADRVAGFGAYKDGIGEYTVWLGAHTKFSGILTDLRFDPGTLSDEVWIESIELLKDDSIGTKQDDGAKVDPELIINVDSVDNPCDIASVEKNSVNFYPLRKTAAILNAKVDYDAFNNRANFLFGNNAMSINFTNGNISLNKQIIAGKDDFIQKDGITYVKSRIISLLFNAETEEKPDEKKISILTEDGKLALSDESESAVIRRRIKSWAFDESSDIDGWTYEPNTMSSFKLSDGAAVGVVTGGMILYTPANLDIRMGDIKNISIKLRNETDSKSLRLYYITDNDSEWSESKTLTFANIKDKSDKFSKYSVDPSMIFGDTNEKITRLRLSLLGTIGTQSFAIDEFNIEGDIVENTDKTSVSWNTDGEHKTVTESCISWEFNTNGIASGWSFSKSFANISLSGGMLSAEINGTRPIMQTEENLKIKSEDVKNLKLKLQNSTSADKLKVYFITDKSPEWSEDKSFDVNLYENDAVSTVYDIDLSTCEGWKDNIRAIRIEIPAVRGKISVDYLRLMLK